MQDKTLYHVRTRCSILCRPPGPGSYTHSLLSKPLNLYTIMKILNAILDLICCTVAACVVTLIYLFILTNQF